MTREPIPRVGRKTAVVVDWGFLHPRGGLGVYAPGKTMLVDDITFS
jgi:hypothetical protein